MSSQRACPRAFRGSLEVFGCNKTLRLSYSISRTAKLCCVKRQGKSPLKLDPSCFNSELFFVRTHMYVRTQKYVDTYCIRLSNYITPNTLLWHTHCANNATLVGLLALSVASLLTISLPGRLVLSRCLTLTRPSFLVTV